MGERDRVGGYVRLSGPFDAVVARALKRRCLWCCFVAEVLRGKRQEQNETTAVRMVDVEYNQRVRVSDTYNDLKRDWHGFLCVLI